MLSSITTGLATGWRNLLAPDLAIDLGTANTRLYARGHGLIADEPTLIKIQPGTGAVEAVGARAAGSRSWIDSPTRSRLCTPASSPTSKRRPRRRIDPTSRAGRPWPPRPRRR